MSYKSLAPEGINFDDGKVTLVLALNYQCFSMWCRKMHINPRHPKVRYVDRDEHLRGYNSERLRVVSVCQRDWPRERWLRITSDMIQYLQMYRDRGAESIYDYCTPNPPTYQEREEYERKYKNRLRDDDDG